MKDLVLRNNALYSISVSLTITGIILAHFARV